MTRSSTSVSAHCLPSSGRRWNFQAAAIVEELFAQTPAEAWDDLLLLRQHLREGRDWSLVLAVFLRCRCQWEHHAYLPFYRLRTILAAALKLENQGLWEGFPLPALELLLRRRCRSLSDWTRQLQREWFEMGGEPGAVPEALRVVELSSC